MSETASKDMENSERNAGSEEKKKMETPERSQAEDPQTSPGNIREASYIVLFIAAVFAVNAMETGSYRTPWPVALITALAGFGLLGYSWHLQSRSRTKKE